ncbi:MAG: hypothetical protein IPG34_20015 [Rhodocyclaceae bacterium]|nr:hypothetical protein [Rhodocyclaceae bacterium]
MSTDSIALASAEFVTAHDLLEGKGRFSEGKHRRDKDGKFASKMGGAVRSVVRSARRPGEAKTLVGDFGRTAGAVAGARVGIPVGSVVGARVGRAIGGLAGRAAGKLSRRGPAFAAMARSAGRDVGAVAGMVGGGIYGGNRVGTVGSRLGRDAGDAIAKRTGLTRKGTYAERVAATAAGAVAGGLRVSGGRGGFSVGIKGTGEVGTNVRRRAASSAFRKAPHLQGGKLGKPGTTGTAFVGRSGALKGKMGPGFKMTPKTLAAAKRRLKLQKLLGKWKPGK